MASSQPQDGAGDGREEEPEQRKHVEDLLDEALEESFPASDAPAVSFPEPEAAPNP
jgi:hypothetical protein